MHGNNITAIILVKNGAETLPRALESIAWCDAVIVGDDGSSDTSIELAKDFGADVIKVRQTSSFAEKRNELLSYAQTGWVLFLDADEVVTPALHSEIENGQWKTDDEKKGFLIQRTDVFLGKKLQYGETSHTRLLRLARKDAGTWKRAVHEVWDVSGNIGTLSGKILHYSHPDLDEFFEKIDRYTELEAEERSQGPEQSGQNVKVYFQLFTYPIAKFIQNYILRGGCLDGFPGFVMAYMMSLHSLCVRIKMLERLKGEKKKGKGTI